MNADQLEHLRHSCAHLLAAAVMRLWPHTKRTIGPSIENGFYFDFDFGETKISEADFPAIEAAMRDMLPTWKKFERHELNAEEAKREYPGNAYKHELIDEFTRDGQKVSFYKSGDYWDLCRGGHVERPDEALEHFKLLSVAGAYWRGSEKNPMLTRIYGTCFPTREELDAYLTMLEEAGKRDHKRLGPELDLFTFSDLVGAGLPLWTPRGTLLRHLLDDFVWQLRKKCGYERVEIPHITKKELYVTSGHWEKFQNDLFQITTREGHAFAMKPMNCPHHTQIYKRRQWSYRDVPQRYANTTMCYRDEQTGELSGLSRVRSFTQDDAHVFCRMSQAKEEFVKIWDIVHVFYRAFGFDLRVRRSLHDPAHPEKYLGDPKRWEIAENMLREIAREKQADTFDGVGEAAFYGPKLDFMAKDSIGREWQVATIQLDLNMPERFDLTCVNEKGEHERIVMIHAAIMGSIERFLSVLIEHTAGAFPLWLAPVQVRLATVSEDFVAAAQKFASELQDAGVRVELDVSDEKVGKKIRNASLLKVPWTIVIGAKEAEGGDFHVRVFGQDEEVVMPRTELVERLKKESPPPMA
jgi:threonyl-tRNA synthetase